MNKVKKILLPALFAATLVGATGAILSVTSVQAKAEVAPMMNVTLTDGILVNYYLEKTGDTAPTVTVDSAVDALDATLNTTTSTEYQGTQMWKYVYDKVTPQYVDQQFTIADGTQQKTTSVAEYCQDLLVRIDTTGQQMEVAMGLLYYGDAAKAYKMGTTMTATPATAFNGEDAMSLTGSYTADNKILSATVVFDAVPALKFNFKKASATATVTVDGADVTSQLTEKDGVYTYIKTGVYATDFDKQYEVVFTDGDKVQTLKYSINDYAARTVANDKLQDDKMKTLAESLWCYGKSAEILYNTPAVGTPEYIIVETPTFAKEGSANNGEDTIVLPKLNITDYHYGETETTAEFTYKSHPEIIITKEIAGAITIDGTGYNNVSANLINKNLFADYIDGVWTLTTTNAVQLSSLADAENLVLAGGDLQINGSYGSKTAVVTVKSGATFTINGGHISMKDLTVEEGATFNAASAGEDTVQIWSAGTMTVSGTVNIVSTTTDMTGTGINVKAEGGTLFLNKTADINITNQKDYIGSWSGTGGILSIPYDCKIVNYKDTSLKVPAFVNEQGQLQYLIKPEKSAYDYSQNGSKFTVTTRDVVARLTIDGVEYKTDAANVDTDKFTLAYVDNVIALTLKADVEIQNAYGVTVTGTGTLTAKGWNNFNAITCTGLVVESSAIVDVNGAIDVTNITVEEGATLSAVQTVKADAVLVNNMTVAGKVSLIGPSGNTGIKFVGSSPKLILRDTAKVSISNFQNAMGCWDGPTATIVIPYDYTMDTPVEWGDKFVPTNEAGNTLISISSCSNGYTGFSSKIAVAKESVVVVDGTAYYEEIANTETEKFILTCVDGAWTLTLKGDVTIKSEIANLTVNGTGNMTVEENSSMGAITCTSLTVKSGATLNVVGQVNATNIIVEEGATFNVTNSNADTVVIKNGGTFHIAGTVTVTKTGAQQKTGIKLDAGGIIQLERTADVTIKGFEIYMGCWSGTPKVVSPYDCTMQNYNDTTIQVPAYTDEGGQTQYLFKLENCAKDFTAYSGKTFVCEKAA